MNSKWELLTVISESDEGVGGQSTIKINEDKTIIKKTYKEKDKKYFLNEKIILQKLKHPNIIELFNFDENNYTLYLPYYELGSAFNYYKKDNKIDLSNDYETLFKLFKDILSALKYLYENNITHRDIKLENILLDKDGNHILCDFGLSKPQIHKMIKTCGTYDYMAPELAYLGKDNNVVYNYKIDIFSLGALIIELGNGDNLFYDNYRQRFKRIYRELNKFLENNEKKIFNEIWYSNNEWNAFRLILKEMIQPDPEKRITYDKIYNLIN